MFMQIFHKARSSLLILMMILLLSFLLFTDFGDSQSRLIDEVFNYGHLILFGLVVIFILWLINRRTWPCRDIKLYVLAGAVTILLGLASEFIQLFTPGRFFELVDILYDITGTVAFLALTYPLPGNTRASVRFTFKVVPLAMILAASLPMVAVGIDSWDMKRDFPLMASFETSWEMSRWEAKESTFTRSKNHAFHGAHSLMATLNPGEYPGVSLEQLEPVWSGYNRFCFDAFLEGSLPLKMTIRVHDINHNDTLQDRYNMGFILMPGNNHLTFALEDIRKAPRGREMDMRGMAGIMIFSYKLHEPRTVYFDNFRLEKKS